ncbi:MAG: ABC transporter substrate-binding protein [Acidobacteria bacterium]|nr:ABC transporter substrate-binding protein [Acidobacteriota bacterium]MBV9477697.1 ABC transporter substrate-binding protein [Acidobacteriota bacterium]
MKRILLGALLVVAAAVACRHEQPAQRPAMATLRMNLNPNLGYGPLMVANDEGYFAAEGIRVEFVPLDVNSALVALTTGKVDVLSTPVRSGLFNLMAKGVPMQIVADRGHAEPGRCSAEAFAATPETAERIARTKSFKGERFAIIRGGITEYLIDRLLAHEHLTRNDVEFAQLPQGVGGNAEYFRSHSKQIDAIRYTQEPTLSNNVAAGVSKVVARMDEVAPGVQFGVILFGKRLLNDDPELGRRFMRAYLRGARKYNEGKTDRNVAIMARYTKLPPDIIRRACWQPIANDARVSVPAMNDFLAWSRKNSYLDADVPASRWWNPSYIDAAVAAH